MDEKNNEVIIENSMDIKQKISAKENEINSLKLSQFHNDSTANVSKKKNKSHSINRSKRRF